jgi:protein SCO1
MDLQQLSRRGFVTGLGVLALAGCDSSGVPGGAFKSVDITGANYALGFDLPDVEGKRRTLADFKGRAVVVFFGFTQCPDVCPTTLAELAQARTLLGKDGERVQGIFVTLDPARDTAELLRNYVGNFGKDFVALRGSEAEIKAAAQHFKVFYGKVPGKTEGSYTIDHTAASFVFDAQGRIRLYTRYGIGPQALADDLKILLKQG